MTLLSYWSRVRPGGGGVVLLLILFLTAKNMAFADVASEGQTAAAANAELWYKYVDNMTDPSWEKVPAELKKTLPFQAWKLMRTKEAEIGEQYGKCLSRKLVSSTFSSPLEMKNGAKMDGEFITLVYECRYANNKSAFETFYFKRNIDSGWPEIGYLIQAGDSPNL